MSTSWRKAMITALLAALLAAGIPSAQAGGRSHGPHHGYYGHSGFSWGFGWAHPSPYWHPYPAYAPAWGPSWGPGAISIGYGYGNMFPEFSGEIAVALVPRAADVADHALPLRQSIVRIDPPSRHDTLAAGGLERPRAPGLALFGAGEPADDLRRIRADGHLDQSAQQRIVGAHLGQEFDLAALARQ